MKVFFVVLILCHLFVTKSMASSAYGWFKNKGTEGDDILRLGVNNTDGPNNQYSESRSRRSIVDPEDPNVNCYREYFMGHKPPTGFRPPKTNYIKFICQQLKPFDETYYATMFDQRIGIAVYAAYRVKHDEVPLIGTFPRVSKWIQDPDINGLQGSNQMYDRNTQKIHKGHLIPAKTYSFDCIKMVSTFRFTNAVPQYAAFNTGQWNQYEDKVRKFASNMCRSNQNGDLYLLTGTSEAKLVAGGSWQKQPLTYFPVNNPNTGTNIVIPNSMWTAGCCINQHNVVGGFAAIGNNVQVNPEMHQVTVEALQDILAKGIGGGATIELFPGNKLCSNAFFQYRYENGGTTPGWVQYH